MFQAVDKEIDLKALEAVSKLSIEILVKTISYNYFYFRHAIKLKSLFLKSFIKLNVYEWLSSTNPNKYLN